MEVKNAKVSDNKVLVGLKRQRADACETYLMSDGVPHGLPLSKKKAIFVEQDSVPRSSCIRALDGCTNNCSQNSLIKNYTNFMKSGILQRLMYCQNGEWNDVSEGLKLLVQDGFHRKRAITEVLFEGDRLYFDFLRMVKVDLVSGLQQLIAWIDESGNCFFPELHSDFHVCTCRGKEPCYDHLEPNGTREIEVKVEISVNSKGSLNFVETDKDPVGCAKQFQTKPSAISNQCDKTNAQINEATEGHEFIPIPSSQISNFGLIRLFNGRKDYQVVEKMFLAGIGRFIRANSIVGIYRAPLHNTLVHNRKKLFHKQEAITKNLRGNANMKYGWIAPSPEDVKGIMLDGIGHYRRSSLKPLYGFGVHLTSSYYSHISACHSDVDENGLHHMILCRVTMGNTEAVPLGSEQSKPSSDNFDSAVDDLMKPTYLTVWDMNMNSHIFPEYVVSFTLPPGVRGILADKGSMSGDSVITNTQNKFHSVASTDSVDSCKQLPRIAQNPDKVPRGFHRIHQRRPQSPWMPFPMLFDAISKKMPREHMDLIYSHYNEFLKKKTSRIDLINRLRMIVGDKLLKSTIMSIQNKSPLIRRHEPGSGTASQASN